MSEQIEITPLGGDDVLSILDQMLDVYLEVYAEPPYCAGPLFHAEAFLERTRVQASRAGFGCVTATDPTTGLLGFAFGLPFGPDRWWSGEATDPPEPLLAAEKFALIELVLRKPWRGRGIGHRLHDTLLATRTERYAILTAMPDAPARVLYTRWGWIQTGTARHVPDSPVMDSLALPLPINPSSNSAAVEQP